MMVENGKTLCQCAWFSLSEVDQELIVVTEASELGGQRGHL